MRSEVGRWILGLVYIFAVAAIWIGSSFVVQSVVDAGVPPFLITYICNSLFVVYIPLVEIKRFLEDRFGSLLFWQNREETGLHGLGDSEEVVLLQENDAGIVLDSESSRFVDEQDQVNIHDKGVNFGQQAIDQADNVGLDAKGRWTRTRVAKVSLLICPFWFLAQFTFNLSLKYTTVTVCWIMY